MTKSEMVQNAVRESLSTGRSATLPELTREFGEHADIGASMTTARTAIKAMAESGELIPNPSGTGYVLASTVRFDPEADRKEAEEAARQARAARAKARREARAAIEARANEDEDAAAAARADANEALRVEITDSLVSAMKDLPGFVLPEKARLIAESRIGRPLPHGSVSSAIDLGLRTGLFAVTNGRGNSHRYTLAEVLAARMMEQEFADREAQAAELAAREAKVAARELAAARKSAGKRTEAQAAKTERAKVKAQARVEKAEKAQAATGKGRRVDLYEGAPEGHRKCAVCGEFHPLADFTRDKSQPDGLLRRCRSCDTRLATARRNALKARRAAAAATA
jgi:hypothetical protein